MAAETQIRPLRTAAIIALIYILLIALYIWLSGKIAAGYASSVEGLEHLELVKGMLFVLVTGVALFFGAFWLLRRIEKKSEIILAQNRGMIASERLFMAGIFAASVSHDINNILQVIVGNAGEVRTFARLDQKDRQHIDQILSAAQRLSLLNRRLMKAGSGHLPGEIKQTDAVLVVKETVEFARVHKRIKPCRLSCDMPEEVNVHLNAALFQRALMNMILNAAESSAEPVDILVRLIPENGENRFTLEVHDSGNGIPEEYREKIFDPFFTSKTGGNGLGLLSLKICTEQHDGQISLMDSHLGGTCVRMTLPVDSVTTSPTS